jgi:hypothetical protein
MACRAQQSVRLWHWRMGGRMSSIWKSANQISRHHPASSKTPLRQRELGGPNTVRTLDCRLCGNLSTRATRYSSPIPGGRTMRRSPISPAPSRLGTPKWPQTNSVPTLPRAPRPLLSTHQATLGSFEFAKNFLASCNTAVVPGVTLGPSCDSYVRVAFTTGENDLWEGVRRLRSHIETLAASH